MQEYRSAKEIKRLKNLFFNIFYHNPKKIKKLLRDFKKDYDEMERLAKKLKLILKTKRIDAGKIIKLIYDFSYHYQRIWAPVIFIYWLPIWVKSKKLTKAQKLRLRKIINARYLRDKEYNLALEFFDDIFRLLRKFFSLACDLELCTTDKLALIIANTRCPRWLTLEIKRRKRGCIITHGKIFSSKNDKNINNLLRKYRVQIPKEPKLKLRKIFQGQIACKGRARGVVKMLFSGNDMKKIKKGNIIVSPMTTPYFNSVLKKAVAIITDEGGITCHAAIVSRELKIPCIINTKIATKVLHDGQLVEVDATKGLVKIIK
ncbi:MAG: PEP-utilizing enzyme [Patescibacteria group bacterium]